MKSHELARALLALPDKPVVLHSTEDSDAIIEDARDAGSHISLGWVPA